MPVNKTCPICLESFVGNKIDKFVKLPCKHLYHQKCIHKYFEHHGKEICPCALCRKPFNKLNLKDRRPLKWILRNRTINNIKVDDNKIVCLLGANGAGKSTTLKAISGLLKSELGEVTRGNIEFNGVRIDHEIPQNITQTGIVHVFEGRRLFRYLTVEENLMMGAYLANNNAI